MKFQPDLPGTISDRLLDDCLEFYPIFARWPKYQEVLDWETIIGGKVSLQTFKAILRKARKIYNETLD